MSIISKSIIYKYSCILMLVSSFLEKKLLNINMKSYQSLFIF